MFSVAFLNPKEGFAAGGDYKETRMAGINGAVTADGGATWTPVAVQPAGYMSVVVPVPGAPRALVAVDELPLLPNGKPDRLRLRELA